MAAIRRGIFAFGPANTTVLAFETLMDSKALFLTPNTSLVYMTAWLDLRDGPMVVETPPNVLGFIDDAWFHYVVDFGNAGPDRGQGRRYLVLPPGHDGDVPDGYHVARSETYGNWVIWRGFLVDGDPRPAVDATRQHFRMYRLSERDDPPEMAFVDVSGTSFNTIHSMDFGFFEEVDEVVQAEPPDGQDPEILGLLASIGIRVGRRSPRTRGCGGSSSRPPTSGRRRRGRSPPVPAVVPVGAGSQYAVAYLGADGQLLDGSRTYRVHLPPDIPARNFWSFVVYDNQTRSMLQTDQRFPGVSTARQEVRANDDGSVDVYFGPVPPAGMENNWIQTIPGRGWNVILRLYGPLQPWSDKTWRPGDPEPVG